MNFKTLANKWRPKKFSEVIGQDFIIQALYNSIIKKNIHHAYIFSGTRGVGKTTIARLFAKALNCINIINNMKDLPCCKCIFCKEIENNIFIDLIEIDAASRTGVEDIRELLDKIHYLPTKGIFKIYLIDEAHMLSKHSFNALLKNLEEPPNHVKFFLATTEVNKLPITIMSRCIRFNLKTINEKLIYKQLKYILNYEKIKIDEEALKILSYNAQGSIRDAITLTEQAIAMNNETITAKNIKTMLCECSEDTIFDLVKFILECKYEKMMFLIDEISSKNIEWDNILIQLLKILHYINIIQIIPKEIENINHKNKNKIIYLASLSSIKNIQLFYQNILIGRKYLKLAPDSRIGFEMILLRLICIQKETIIIKKEKCILIKDPKKQHKNDKLKSSNKNLLNIYKNLKNIKSNNKNTNNDTKNIEYKNTELLNKNIKNDQFIFDTIKLFDAEIKN